jgi:hypothetical protein
VRSRGVQTPIESGLEPILLPVEGRAGPQCASVHRRCHLRPDKPAAIEVCCGSEARARPAESTSTPASSHTCSAAEICCSHSTTCTHGTCSTVCCSTAKLSIRLLSQPETQQFCPQQHLAQRMVQRATLAAGCRSSIRTGPSAQSRSSSSMTTQPQRYTWLVGI